MLLTSMRDLFAGELREVYDAENQLIAALPRMAQGAASGLLRSAFEEHYEQTRGHVQRLERVFEALGADRLSRTCDAMTGMLKDAERILAAGGEEWVKDAALIGAAQKVEHFEIAAYGCLASWAKEMGDASVSGLLALTLNEEKTTDERLTRLAEELINARARKA